MEFKEKWFQNEPLSMLALALVLRLWKPELVTWWVVAAFVLLFLAKDIKKIKRIVVEQDRLKVWIQSFQLPKKKLEFSFTEITGLSIKRLQFKNHFVIHTSGQELVLPFSELTKKEVQSLEEYLSSQKGWKEKFTSAK